MARQNHALKDPRRESSRPTRAARKAGRAEAPLDPSPGLRTPQPGGVDHVPAERLVKIQAPATPPEDDLKRSGIRRRLFS
ncbi:MAG: hypothetical protein ACFCGT_20950 [Sandaracinaceae bacterium]